ncbi:diguanylate cyclase or its enzymatically inactive variants [Pseudomonas syringae pv. actinidiae]|uniref:diguanylate cyclase n=2 Tax=Pseudomonas syringae pv. actinidiae TaxID=103796 RepID=A0A2V0QGR4_PSESF|nr:diguanylate cyclase or its enzymatically inactive variants [Pseudomonas syringae pv. actinidiae]
MICHKTLTVRELASAKPLILISPAKSEPNGVRSPLTEPSLHYVLRSEEMNFPTQTHAIDFDTAELQRLGFRNRPDAVLPPPSLPELVYQLGRQLQTSLEAERILTLFFQGVQRFLPLNGLAYRHVESDLHLRLGEMSSDSASFHLRHEGKCIGELEFQGAKPFDTRQLRDLESLLVCLVYPLLNALLYRIATQTALRDPLTSTGNRIAMDQSLAREIEISSRHKQPLSLLMLDIDHFKKVNDEYGHHTGDDVLKTVAQSLKAQLRNIDRVFRYGGEEFVVILSNTGVTAAELIGERLRQAVRNLEFRELDPALTMTVSLGCSTLLPTETADSLLRRADNALYVAKREGRNRLAMAS